MIAIGRKRARRGNVAGVVRLVGLGALALGAACTTKGDGLILVELMSSPPPDHVACRDRVAATTVLGTASRPTG